MPATVVLPSAPTGASGSSPGVVVHAGRDGQPVVLVFSSVERLRASLGAAQSWMEIPFEHLGPLLTDAGVTDVVVDPGPFTPPGPSAGWA